MKRGRKRQGRGGREGVRKETEKEGERERGENEEWEREGVLYHLLCLLDAMLMPSI